MRSKCKVPDRNRYLPKFVNVYTDSDWASQPTTWKSTSGGVVEWGNATLTAWSRTQQTVSLSSAEAKLYALTTGMAESQWCRTVLEMKGATDTFAAVWAVKMLNCLGLSDIILLCDPEPSLIKWVREGGGEENMCTRLFLEPNIEDDVTTRPRSDETAQVDLDTETVH